MTSSEHDVASPEPPADGTSRSLLAQAKAADPAAWERLVRLYAPLVATWCRRWKVGEQDIADLIQEVFAAVARNLNRFSKDQPEDTFRGWIAVIARNKAHDYHRRRMNQPAAAGGTEANLRLAQIPGFEDESELDELADPAFGQVLQRALAAIRGEFHDRTWQAFWSVVVDGQLASDVAANLGMQPGAVRVAKSRVLLRLRRELGDATSEAS